MGKGNKPDVHFILPEPADVGDPDGEYQDYLEPPYTSILMSTASGDGCANKCRNSGAPELVNLPTTHCAHALHGAPLSNAGHAAAAFHCAGSTRRWRRRRQASASKHTTRTVNDGRWVVIPSPSRCAARRKSMPSSSITWTARTAYGIARGEGWRRRSRRAGEQRLARQFPRSLAGDGAARKLPGPRALWVMPRGRCVGGRRRACYDAPCSCPHACPLYTLRRRRPAQRCPVWCWRACLIPQTDA